MTGNRTAQASLVLAAGAMLAGCASTTRYQEVELPPGRIEAFCADKPASLHPLCEKLLRQGFRNEVLNAMRVGLCAMELGDDRLAMQMFTLATTGIERILADDPEVMRIMKRQYGEGAKPFKGEAYERAMAYYYRGLLHLREGDYFRGRACFKAGLTQDAFAEADEYRADFALMTYLDGWAAHCGGEPGLARDAFDYTRRMRPGLSVPVPGDGRNVLVVVETGAAPRKVSDGLGHYQLKFRRGRGFTEEAAEVVVAGRTIALTPIEDVYRQSRTRGKREIDYVLAGKGAKYKQATEIGGGLASAGEDVALVGSAFGGPVSAVGGALAAAGMVATASQMNANPEADTRYWDNLPDKVHVGVIAAAAGDSVEVRFRDGAGRLLTGLTQRATVGRAGEYGMVWVRSRKSNPSQMAQRDYWDNLGN